MGVEIEITDEQAAQLRDLTHEEDLSEAVGRAIQHLAEHAQQDEREARLAAMTPEEREAALRRGWDALSSMSGMIDGGGDLADRHDYYLYGAGAE